MSRISIISVFSRCLIISLKMSSLSFSSSIPIRCSESSVIRSNARPVISCWFYPKKKHFVNKQCILVTLETYLLEEVTVGGAPLAAVPPEPLLRVGHRPQVDRLGAGRFALKGKTNIKNNNNKLSCLRLNLCFGHRNRFFRCRWRFLCLGLGHASWGCGVVAVVCVNSHFVQ